MTDNGQLEFKSFFSHRTTLLDRKAQFINSASQILQRPLEKEDVFGQIFKGLSTASKSYVSIKREVNPNKNGFIVDEESKKQMDDLMGVKWGEQLKTEQPINQSLIQPNKRQSSKSYTQSIDALINKSPEEFLFTNDVQVNLKTIIAEQVAAKVKTAYLLEIQIQQEKQDKLKEKVFFKQQQPKIDEIQVQSLTPLEQSDLTVQPYKRPKLKFKVKIASQSNLDEDTEQKGIESSLISSIDQQNPKDNQNLRINYNFSLKKTNNMRNDLSHEVLVSSLNNLNELTPEKIFQPIDQISEKISYDPLQLNQPEENQKLMQPEFKQIPFLLPDPSFQTQDWNFQNKIYMSQKNRGRIISQNNSGSNFSQQSITQFSPLDSEIKPNQAYSDYLQNFQPTKFTINRMKNHISGFPLSNKKSAFKLNNNTNKRVSFNHIAFVLLETGQQIEEKVTDDYKIKKHNKQSQRNNQNDIFKYWNF